MEQLTTYTYDEFIDGTAPYEYLYQFHEDGFRLSRELEKMTKIAISTGFRGFKKAYGEYVKNLKKQSNLVYSNSVTQFEGQELELNCGQWQADEFGVTSVSQFGELEACNHPILPVLRLVNIDTGVEKLRLAYRKGKQWRHVIADKKTLASNNSILELANVGVAVNSENAKYLVKYLHDIESLNYDIIPEKNSVSRMGWIDSEGFSPYVSELVFDGDANFRSFFESVSRRGKLDTWMQLAKEVRQRGIFARVVLAGAFASTLVKPMGGLPFFIHLWGGTETGKTVGLMLAASVWANPEMGRFIHTFNSTAVGREKSAAFVNSLPLILDELQIVKDKKEFDKDIYMLSEGAGRTRGNKTGGVDKTPTWSNCIITSGEMPITSSASGGGAVNRIVEIECKDRLFDDPKRVADTVKRNYGFAGRMFVDRLQEDGIIEQCEAIFKRHNEHMAASDTTEKQAMAAAMILTADELVTTWFFKDNRALTAEEIGEFLRSKASVSAHERAYEYLCEYVVQNKNRFKGESDREDVWGLLDGLRMCIVRREFNRICEDAGFSSQAFLSWLKQNGKLDTNGKGMTRSKRINGEPCNCVCVYLPDCEDASGEYIPD